MKPRLAPVLLVCLLASRIDAQTSYPMLMSIDPVAAQVGTTSEHTVASRYSMHGSYQVLVSGSGVTGEVIPPETKEGEDANKKPNLESLKVRFSVAADAAPGVRDFRLLTANGASTMGQLVVTPDPVLAEDKNNDTPLQAQSLTLPVALCGAIEKAEDRDYYKFTVAAGAGLSFHVRCMRLEDRIHDLQEHADPILTVRNSAGSIVAACDNYFAGDPFLFQRFDQAGEYTLEIRDVRFKGNQYWQYSVEINDRPFIEAVHPLGVQVGQPTNVELIGFATAAPAITSLTVPSDTPLGASWLSIPLANSPHGIAPFVASTLPQIVESEDAASSAEQGQLITIPAGVSGRIGSESDVDCYTFEAKQGEKYSFEIGARRAQSKLDAHLRILDASGKELSVNDDMQIGRRSSPDSQIENWTVPADGKYTAEIRDLHLRGGAGYVYHLQVDVARPYFKLFLDTDKTNITPGTSSVVFVRVERKNGFTGPVQLKVDGLPAGVTASCGRILGGKGQDGCIVMEAAPDAQRGGANVTITGEAPAESPDAALLQATAAIYQEVYSPGGGRGQWPVSMYTVAVGEPSDIRAVTLSTHEITLQPGQSQRVEVKITRGEGFDKNITLDVLFQHLSSIFGDSLPEGVTLDAKNSKTLLTGTESEGFITLQAAADAPAVERQQIVVMADVAINFVMKASYTSKPVFITVPAPTTIAVAGSPGGATGN